MPLIPWKLATRNSLSKFEKSGSLKDNLSSPIIVSSVSLAFGKPEKSLFLMSYIFTILINKIIYFETIFKIVCFCQERRYQ